MFACKSPPPQRLWKRSFWTTSFAFFKNSRHAERTLIDASALCSELPDQPISRHLSVCGSLNLGLSPVEKVAISGTGKQIMGNKRKLIRRESERCRGPAAEFHQTALSSSSSTRLLSPSLALYVGILMHNNRCRAGKDVENLVCLFVGKKVIIPALRRHYKILAQQSSLHFYSAKNLNLAILREARQESETRTPVYLLLHLHNSIRVSPKSLLSAMGAAARSVCARSTSAAAEGFAWFPPLPLWNLGFTCILCPDVLSRVADFPQKNSCTKKSNIIEKKKKDICIDFHCLRCFSVCW